MSALRRINAWYAARGIHTGAQLATLNDRETSLAFFAKLSPEEIVEIYRLHTALLAETNGSN